MKKERREREERTDREGRKEGRKEGVSALLGNKRLINGKT